MSMIAYKCPNIEVVVLDINEGVHALCSAVMDVPTRRPPCMPDHASALRCCRCCF